MSLVGTPAGPWLKRHLPTRRVAWVLAVAGPVLVALALLPFRPSLGPGGFLLVSLAAFAVAGLAAVILIGRLARLAGEQTQDRQVEAALRRVATLVAHGTPADDLFSVVAEEVARLVAADFSRMGRYDSDDSLTYVAAWSRTGEPFPVGSRWPLAGENVSILVSRTGRPARMDDLASASGPLAAQAREWGVRSVSGVPIMVEDRIWGVMVAGSSRRRPPPDTEARLASFTDLLATAISNADSRAGLTRLAQEQTALRRVATLVACGALPEEVFAAVSEEAGQLLQAGQTTMNRYEPDGTVTVVASWSRTGGAVPLGAREPLGGNNLTTIVAQTRRPARLGRYADASGPAAAVAREADFRSAIGTPIIVQGRLWGVMAAASVDELPLAPDTEARLASFTELVATAVSNAENLAELRASRARVVATADETRRQIERDLHDGAQQRLVSLARRSTVPVQLDVSAPARLPERVEVAAYYVVSEALANAAKYANASVIHVAAEAAGPVLHLSVRDDGDGGADPDGGTGLVGLKDRVEALGGTITVHSPPGAGTTLHAELPLTG